VKFYRSKQCCGADITAETAMMSAYRGSPPQRKRAKKIYHARGDERFWHWSDQVVVEPPTDL